MEYKLVTGALETLDAEALAVGVFENGDLSVPRGAAGLREAAGKMRFKGKAGECFWAFEPYGEPRKHLLVVGLGKQAQCGPAAYRAAATVAARKFRERYIRTAAVAFPAEGRGAQAGGLVQALVEGAFLGNLRFDRYLTDENAKFEGLGELLVHVQRKGDALEKGARLGALLADGVLFARRLVTEPANVLTPERMAKEARKVAKEAGLEIEVLGARECEKLGMGAYMAVAKGSRHEPRFIHLRYRPGKKPKFKLGLVGKGLTFDSGGLSLKPNEGMAAMKSDMSGSAAVLGAMKVIGSLKPKNVAVEAIEVLNTDAEGRLTLADALTYVQKQEVDCVVDLATLTGACVVALGPDFTGAMTNDQKLLDKLLDSAKEAGEEFWQLPLPPAYNKFIQTPVADVANVGRVRWGGALTAGLFLQKFIDEGTPWVHLDIAGPAFRDEDGAEAFRSEGTGVGVRTIVRFVMRKST
jgi:leucyl aminopeptidase